MKAIIPSFIPIDKFAEYSQSSEITIRRMIKAEKSSLLAHGLLRIDRSVGNRFMLSRNLLSRFVHKIFLDAINTIEKSHSDF